MPSLLDRFTSPQYPGLLVQALNPRWGSKLPGARNQGTIESVTPTGRDAVAVRIHAPRGWAQHVPGQFVTIGVDVDGVRHHRSFTLTSVPRSPGSLIEITVQAQVDGLVSRHLVDSALPGEVVQLDGPHGDFVLPEMPTPLLLLTGGSGITPAIAMVRTLARLPRGADVVLVHHAASNVDILHGRELASMAESHDWLRLVVIETRADDGRSIPGTHLDAERLDDLCGDWRDRDAFVCGPESMLEFVRGHWADQGVQQRLHLESFSAPDLGVASVDPEDAGPFDVQFAGSACRADAPADATLLAVAEGAGLRPANGCRMGICHTCSTPLRSGVARDMRNGRLVEAGTNVQLCVSAAAADVVLDL